MSAWPEAVWVTKQIKHNFEINSNIKVYQDELNQWEDDLDTLSETVEQQSVIIQEIQSAITPPIVSKSVDGQPEYPPEEIKMNSIWFILQDNQITESTESGG